MILTIQYIEKRDETGPPRYKAYLGAIHIGTILYSFLDNEKYIVKWVLPGPGAQKMYAETYPEAQELIRMNLSNWLYKAGIKYETLV